ncbi:MAG: cation-translocating P-type ATPase [Planctomycetes bacterium]|nr:cation-translocating P-type ATPase [Planctomycetota bacterium]
MSAPAETLLLEIAGMRCAGCADTLTAALRGVAGVAQVEVSYAAGLARVTGSGIELPALQAAVAEAGYVAAASGATAARLHERAQRRALLVAVLLAGMSLFVPHDAPIAHALLAVVALLGPGRPFLRGALAALRARTGTMDLLVALGAGAATLLSFAAALRLLPPALDHGHAAVWLIAFLSVGKWLEARARAGTSAHLNELLELLPARARRRRADGVVEEVAASELQRGDVVVVAAGEKLPADGTVREGASSIDEATLRGEPLPRDVAPGAAVAGGTVNLQAPLTIAVTASGAASQVGQIGRLVRDALAQRAPVVTFAERVAAWFVPVVIALSLLTLLGQLLSGAGVVVAVGRALATVVISCPCALALATPTALVAALNGALLRGALVKETALLERLAAVTSVLFDKTGTLTEGALAAGAPLPIAGGAAAGESLPSDQRRLLAALAGSSRHAAAQAVARRLAMEAAEAAAREPAGAVASPPPFLLGVEERAGLGVRVRHGGREWRLGRIAFALEVAPLPTDLPHDASLVAASVDGRLLAAWPLLDRLRPSAAAAVAALQRSGVAVALVTGDRRPAALAVARALGLADEAVHADCTPAEKAAVVAARESAHGPTLFVGDGFNDAAALAGASVGAAMGGRQATDLARAAGGVVLLRDDPAAVAELLELARATRRILRQNVALAIAYNVVALPWAMGLLARFGVTAPEPAAAGLAMAASSLAVVANALRLARGPRRDRLAGAATLSRLSSTPERDPCPSESTTRSSTPSARPPSSA